MLMDERRQSILKQKERLPLQELPALHFPDDDETETTTVTRSRRVSFGTNLVKEFIVGSAVSTQCVSEYELAFSSSDSSNANSTRSGCNSQLYDRSSLLCQELPKKHPNDQPDLCNTSKKLKRTLPDPDQSQNREPCKFSSTICFSADSPTADLEFTEGCISLAKNIFDRKKKDITVYIQAKSMENLQTEQGNETILYKSDDGELSITKCAGDFGEEDDTNHEDMKEQDDEFITGSDLEMTEFCDKPFSVRPLTQSDDFYAKLKAQFSEESEDKTLPSSNRSLTELLKAKPFGDDSDESGFGLETNLEDKHDDSQQEPIDFSRVGCDVSKLNAEKLEKSLHDKENFLKPFDVFNKKEVSDNKERMLININEQDLSENGEVNQSNLSNESMELTQTKVPAAVELKLDNAQSEMIEKVLSESIKLNNSNIGRSKFLEDQSVEDIELNKSENIEKILSESIKLNQSMANRSRIVEDYLSESFDTKSSDEDMELTQPKGVEKVVSESLKLNQSNIFNRSKIVEDYFSESSDDMDITRTENIDKVLSESKRLNQSQGLNKSKIVEEYLSESNEDMELTQPKITKKMGDDYMDLTEPKIFGKLSESLNLDKSKVSADDVEANQSKINESLNLSQSSSYDLEMTQPKIFSKGVSESMNLSHSKVKSNDLGLSQPQTNAENLSESLNCSKESNDDVEPFKALPGRMNWSLTKDSSDDVDSSPVKINENGLSESLNLNQSKESNEDVEVLQTGTNRKDLSEILNLNDSKASSDDVEQFQPQKNLSENLDLNQPSEMMETSQPKINEKDLPRVMELNQSEISSENMNLSKQSTESNKSVNESVRLNQSEVCSEEMEITQPNIIRKDFSESLSLNQSRSSCDVGNDLSDSMNQSKAIDFSKTAGKELSESIENKLNAEDVNESNISNEGRETSVHESIMDNGDMLNHSNLSGENKLTEDVEVNQSKICPDSAELSQSEANKESMELNHSATKPKVIFEPTPEEMEIYENKKSSQPERLDESSQNEIDDQEVCESMEVDKRQKACENMEVELDSSKHVLETMQPRKSVLPLDLDPKSGAENASENVRMDISEFIVEDMPDRAEISIRDLSTQLSEDEEEPNKRNAAENSSTDKIRQNESSWLNQTPSESPPQEDSPGKDSGDTTSQMEDSQMDGGSFKDAMIVKTICEQSKEENCLWTFQECPKGRENSVWSFVVELLNTKAVIELEVKSAHDCEEHSVILDKRIRHETPRHLYHKIVATATFGFSCLKEWFALEKKRLKTTRDVSFFLDRVNLFMSKLQNVLRQVLIILRQYPGSNLTGYKLSFRLWSIVSYFDFRVVVDLQNFSHLSRDNLSFEESHGKYDFDKIKDIFQECLRSEDFLVELVISSTRDIVNMEKSQGKLSYRNHYSILPRDLVKLE